MSSSTNFSWESGPMHLLNPSSQPTTIATDLSTITNIFIRALNSIYIQAPCIPLSQSSHFTTYTLSIYHCLTAYESPELAHMTSGQQLPPAFDAPLRAWGAWLESCAARRNNFSSAICRGFMDDFMPGLQRHFAALPGAGGLANLEDAMIEAHVKKVFSGMSRTGKLPGMLCNHDRAMGELSGGLSGWETWMVRNVWAKKFKEVWKFGTVGWDGRKKEVLFS